MDVSPQQLDDRAQELVFALPRDLIGLSMRVLTHPVVGFGQNVRPHDPARGSFSKAEAWIYFLAHANKRNAQVNNRGEVIRLGVGELVRGRTSLATVWNWSDKTTRHYLETLRDEGMIDIRTPDRRGQSATDQKFKLANIITICNYRRYQMLAEGISSFVQCQQGPVRGQSDRKRGASDPKEKCESLQTVGTRSMRSGASEIRIEGPENSTSLQEVLSGEEMVVPRRLKAVANDGMTSLKGTPGAMTFGALSREKQQAVLQVQARLRAVEEKIHA